MKNRPESEQTRARVISLTSIARARARARGPQCARRRNARVIIIFIDGAQRESKTGF